MLSKISEFVIGLAVRFRSQAGQALAEYGLILALVGLVCVIGLTALGLAIAGQLQRVAECRI